MFFRLRNFPSILGLLRVFTMNVKGFFSLSIEMIRWYLSFILLCSSFSSEFNFTELLEGRYGFYNFMFSLVVFRSVQNYGGLIAEISSLYSPPLLFLDLSFLCVSRYYSVQFIFISRSPQCGYLSWKGALVGYFQELVCFSQTVFALRPYCRSMILACYWNVKTLTVLAVWAFSE